MSSGTTKGSWQRPGDHDKYASNYDAIFGKKDKEKPVVEFESPLPMGTLTCPKDGATLHFEQIHGIRIRRHDDCQHIDYYNAKCPQCNEYFAVHALAREQ